MRPLTTTLADSRTQCQEDGSHQGYRHRQGRLEPLTRRAGRRGAAQTRTSRIARVCCGAHTCSSLMRMRYREEAAQDSQVVGRASGAQAAPKAGAQSDSVRRPPAFSSGRCRGHICSRGSARRSEPAEMNARCCDDREEMNGVGRPDARRRFLLGNHYCRRCWLSTYSLVTSARLFRQAKISGTGRGERAPPTMAYSTSRLAWRQFYALCGKNWLVRGSQRRSRRDQSSFATARTGPFSGGTWL